MLQGKKVARLNSATAREGVGGLAVITHCCALSNEINPFICSSQAAVEQFSLRRQAGSLSFLLALSFDAGPVQQTTPRLLSSGSSVP